MEEALTIGTMLFVIFLATVVVIGLDIYAAARDGFKGTLSWWIREKSMKYPIVPAAIGFTFGLLLAHLFWGQCG